MRRGRRELRRAEAQVSEPFYSPAAWQDRRALPRALMLKLTDLLKEHKEGLRLNPSPDSSPPKLPFLACYPEAGPWGFLHPAHTSGWGTRQSWWDQVSFSPKSELLV